MSQRRISNGLSHLLGSLRAVEPRVRPVVLPLSLTVSALVVACSPAREDLRAEVLDGIVQYCIVDEHEALAEESASLVAAVDALCEAPSDATLETARAAWWSMRRPWRERKALPWGPLVDDGIDTQLDFWPARPTSVEGGIDSGTTTLAELELLGVASVGLPAIEYLLWDGSAAATPRPPLEALADAQRCAYLSLLARDVDVRLADLQTNETEFVGTVRNAGNNDRFPTLARAVDELLNALIGGLHDLDETALAKPYGLEAGTLADPALAESRFSARSAQDVRDAVLIVEVIYLGPPLDGDDVRALGLGDLVAQASPEIDAEVRAQLQTVRDRTNALSESLVDASGVVDPSVPALWVELEALRALLTADVASALGVTVSLTDNDGD